MTPAILWGIATNPSDLATIQTQELAVGKQMSLVRKAQPWFMNAQYVPFPTADMQQQWDRGSLVSLDWANWDLDHKTDPAFGFDAVLAGKHDPFLHTFAQAAASWGHPWSLRFDAEMNGSWWPFGAQPDKFVQAWRYVHALFVADGATNVAWHWCPNVCAPAGTPYSTAVDKLASYYPGDDVVDWTGFDTYNWAVGTKKADGSGWGTPWMTFVHIMNGFPGWLGPTYDTIAALAPLKPMHIGEFGCWDTPGDKAAWLTDALMSLPTRFPLVRAISYFGWAANDSHWPLNMPPAAEAAFRAAIATPLYIAGGSMVMPSRFEPMVLSAQPASVDTAGLQQQIADGQASIAVLQRQLAWTQQALLDAKAETATTTARLGSLRANLQSLTQFAAESG